MSTEQNRTVFSIGDKVTANDCGNKIHTITNYTIEETGREIYQINNKRYYYPEDLKIAPDEAIKVNSSNKIDINNILSANKFIPIWLQREKMKSDLLTPHSIELHLTSVCNYDCYHCSYANRRKSAVYLESEIVERLVDDLKTINPRGVYFSGGGEPTALKNWDKYIEQLSSNKIETALITNGSLIKQHHIPILSKLNYIAISIYSTKNNVAQEITGNKKINHSFALPKEIHKQNGKVVVGARCVINKYNYTEVVDIYNKAIVSGYDYLIFIPEIDYESRGICLTIDQINKMVKIVSSSHIDDRKTNLSSLAGNDFNFYSKKNEVYKQIDCQAIKLRTNAFVNYDGGVYLCQPDIGNQEYCIGNINDERFIEIWNSEKHKNIIEKLEKRWRIGGCENCRSIAFNRNVYKYVHKEYNQPIEIIKDPFV